jgi:hypothetical protein
MSANREMVALGVANVIGGVNVMILTKTLVIGDRAPVCELSLLRPYPPNAGKAEKQPPIVSIITFTCVLVLLPYLYYLPVRPSQKFHLTGVPFLSADHADLSSRKQSCAP